MQQGTPEWFAARCGKVTASRVADVIAKTKTGYGASRANYRAQLITERLTGMVAESYQNEAMRWGTETEPQARAAYSFMHDAEVIEVGMVPHPSIEMSGASPDGMVGTDGLVEIKCPNTATHIETLLSRQVPEKYVTQIFWQMACTGRKWCDFVSFDPRLPPHLQMFVKRVPRDDAAIAALEAEVTAFLAEVEDTLAKLNTLENAA